MKKTTALYLAAFAVLGLIANPAGAQPRYPEKAVRLVVPAPPGSAPDILSRLIGQKLTESWGQSVVIDNVVGASGNIGTDRVAKAPGDGYTLLFNTIGPIAVNVTLFGDKLPYDPLKDLTPISLVTKMPNLVTVNLKVPVHSVKELIALARKEPGRIRYGTAGPGTTQHLSGELLNTLENIKLVAIPYKSSAQMTTDGIGGQFELLIHNAQPLMPHVKAGTLRPIAITSAKRSPILPDIPTMAEAGVPGFEITAWFGFMAPGTTPPALVQRLATDVQRVVAMPEIRDRIIADASEPVGNRPEEYAAFVRAEVEKWRGVIRQANIKAD
jgi:tripartite-type tricarboxylate transporter receptor subunit TctC